MEQAHAAPLIEQQVVYSCNRFLMPREKKCCSSCKIVLQSQASIPRWLLGRSPGLLSFARPSRGRPSAPDSDIAPLFQSCNRYLCFHGHAVPEVADHTPRLGLEWCLLFAERIATSGLLAEHHRQVPVHRLCSICAMDPADSENWRARPPGSHPKPGSRSAGGRSSPFERSLRLPVNVASGNLLWPGTTQSSSRDLNRSGRYKLPLA